MLKLEIKKAQNPGKENQPKHLIAIAVSKITAAFGYVNWLNEKKLAVPLSRYLAHRAWRYSPNPLMKPENTMTNTPKVIPNLAIA